MIWPVVSEALLEAQITLADLSAIAVCHGPGLIGSLLVGCSFAKAVSYADRIPLVAVNHLEGHIFSCFLESHVDEEYPLISQGPPEFPFLSLIVSGGHTSLYHVCGFGNYKELGRTRDDAAGEAFDKVSKLLGLGYPGGPVIESLAQHGDPEAVEFPRAYLPDSLDFSFSGLKTAVANYLRNDDRGERGGLSDICAGFQKAVADVLVRKTEWAVRKERVKRVVLAGGVASNGALRDRFLSLAGEGKLEAWIPPRSLCTDNAAMIASAGYQHFQAGKTVGMDLNPEAYLPL